MTEHPIISSRIAHRKLTIPGGRDETITFCVDDLVQQAQAAIKQRGRFTLALSGGSTPKSIYQALAHKHMQSCDWSKVYIFWSDERCVPPSNPDSNYHMAMENGIHKLPVLKEHIFRMPADASNLTEAAEAYEKIILEHVPDGIFDFIMLGMGDDGHTASLFPGTEGLHETTKLVIKNHIPQKKCDRMTFSYKLLNAARAVRFYVLGESKADLLHQIFTGGPNIDKYPSTKVGTKNSPALWIADESAGKLLQK